MNATVRARRLLGALIGVALFAAACSSNRRDGDGVSATQSPLTVGGCACVSSGTCAALTYSDVPTDGQYYITTFGGGTDTGTMSCGGTADGTWAYVADRSRFSCGAKLLVEANGQSCVAEVADCGPNRCVEEAASGSCGTHFPVLDASPFISSYLFGTSSAGWSDHMLVTATEIDSNSVTGCPGSPIGTGGSGGGSGFGGTGGIGGTGGTSGSGGVATGGTSGSGGAPPSCVAPTCTGCSDCYSQCMCDINDNTTCTQDCFGGGGTGGGSAGSGGTSSGGTSGGGPTSCSAPACDGCVSCFDQCVCDGMDQASCTQICTSSGTGGASSGNTCTAPGCGGCNTCYDTCICLGGDVPTCSSTCDKSDAPGPKSSNFANPEPESGGSCAASIVGSHGDANENASFALAALVAFAGVYRRVRR